MKEKRNLPYGTWPSKITPEMTGGLREFSELNWSGDGRLLWVERYSNHSSLMAWDSRSGKINKLSGDINVGGGIMYGGGSYAVCRDQVVFIEKGSNILYHQPGNQSSHEELLSTGERIASPQLSPSGDYLIFNLSDGKNDSLEMLSLSGNRLPDIISSQFDFYNYPRWHPDGTYLAWTFWNHPHMPWQESHLELVELIHNWKDYPRIGSTMFASRFSEVSTIQPEFSPDGKYLAFLSDKTGWWQIYLYNLAGGTIHQLTNSLADHALPPWMQNQSYYKFSEDSKRIYCIRNQLGFASLWQLNLEFNTENQIEMDPKYSWLESLAVSTDKDQIALIASGSKVAPEIIITSPGSDQRVIRKSSQEDLDIKLFSQPKPLSLETKSRVKIYSLFYPPHNPEFSDKGKPPLLIIIHSGPTRQKYAEFQPRTQFFTSRGYSVLEVNYRGSTGYGRDYWEVLEGQWGILDVEDVYQAANAISKEGLIDKKRIALLGSSSGGLTVLLLLIRYPKFFKAGISLYGITNLNELLKDPPKFERYYHHWLIGDPETAAQVYHDRSPLYSADKIRTPIAIFQGGKDPIVPREQAEQIVEELKKNGVPYEYHFYPDEGHGFKKSENVSDFYQKTEAFFREHHLGIKDQVIFGAE